MPYESPCDKLLFDKNGTTKSQEIVLLSKF